MSDYYNGPASDRLQEFTRARAAEVRAELNSVASAMALLPPRADLLNNRIGYAAATGTNNALLVSVSPAPTAYVDGMGLTVKLSATNTGTATINVNGLGVKPLTRPDGTALSGGDLASGAIVNLRYEGVSGQFRVMVGTLTINQAGVDLVTTQASAYAASALTYSNSAAAYAAAAAASVASYTAADVLSKMVTVDGSGSGLDADVVRGTTPGFYGLTALSFATLAAAKSSLGIDLINNTSDANKPVSTAQAAADALKVSKAGDTMTGPLLLAADPTAALGAATKQYADAISASSPFSGGTAVLATASNDTLSGLAARDGVTPIAGDRVLVPNQTTQSQNGIYVAAAGAWSRSSDANTFAALDKHTILVVGGTQAGGWGAFNGASGTLGTTPVLFQRISNSGAGTASNGITKVANDFQLSPMATLTVKGNATGGTAIPTDLTGAQVASLLPVFGTASGLVPGVASSTSQFLRADGAFVSALTPASVAASGAVSGSNLTGTNTGDQTITLTGPVTGSGAGSFATAIGANVVTDAMMVQVATASFKGRFTAGTGNVEVLTVAQAKTMLNLAGSNTGDQTITLTGDVTGGGTGSFAATIAPNSVTLAKMAQVATAIFLGRTTATTGNVEALTVAQAQSMLSLSGTNTGDQTNVTGNAGTATALQTARTIAITGAVTGTATSFNGSANISIPITALDVGAASTGTLAVARGGTGTTTSTGTGSVVLSNAPTFSGTTTVATLTATGSISASGDVSAYSDARLKKDVVKIDSALAKVLAMKGVSFTRKADGSRSSGVIAQELEQIAPELVATDGDGVKSVAYGNLTAYLIEAVRELTARVAELEAAR